MVLGARWAVENATSRLCVWQGRDVHSSWPELEVGAKEPRRGEMEPTVLRARRCATGDCAVPWHSRGQCIGTGESQNLSPGSYPVNLLP